MARLSVAGFPDFYVLATTTVALVMIIWLVRRRASGNHLPPGPTGLPVVGSLHLLAPLPHRSLAKLAMQYGPLMSIRLGQALYIVASSSDTALEFLHKHDANFCSRPPHRAGQLLFGPDILFQSNSPVWCHLKKMFHTGLTGTKRVEATRHVREEEVARFLRTVPHDREFNLRKHLSALVTSIISRLVLIRSFTAESDQGLTEEQVQQNRSFPKLMGAIFKCLSAFNVADFIPALQWCDFPGGLQDRLKQTQERMDAFASQIVAEHEAQRTRGPVALHDTDMVHILLDEVERYNATARPGLQISMTHVKAIMWDAFSGGTDTILFSCEWIMSEVVSSASVQARAQQELDDAVGRHRRVQEGDIPNLRYIQALVKEGLRLHPIAPLMAPHQSIKACKALGYDIPANTRLLVNVWAIGRDGGVWEKNPLEFRPERWLPAPAMAEQRGFLPFGAGRRMCPGMAMANVTLQYCVASLLQAFEWSVVTPPGMAEAPGVGVPRARPLRVLASPRLAPAFYNSPGRIHLWSEDSPAVSLGRIGLVGFTVNLHILCLLRDHSTPRRGCRFSLLSV